MPTLRVLRRDQHYRDFGKESKHCHTCPKFKHEEAYADVEGMSADLCRLYIDEDGGGVVMLPSDHGVCDSHD